MKLSIKLRVTLLCTLLAALIASAAMAFQLIGEQGMLRDYYRNSLMATAQLARDDIRYEDGDLDIDRNLDDLPSAVQEDLRRGMGFSTLAELEQWLESVES